RIDRPAEGRSPGTSCGRRQRRVRGGAPAGPRSQPSRRWRTPRSASRRPTARRGTARSARTPSIPHVRLAFLVPGAITERDRLEAVALVEATCSVVGGKAVQVKTVGPPALRQLEERAADASPDPI